MSIPDKFLRIARYKLGEIKEYIDQLDEEREQRAEQESERRRVSSDARAEARRELDEVGFSPGSRPAIPVQPPQSARTPDEIARGVRPAGYVGPNVNTPADRTYATPPTAGGAQPPAQSVGPVDPLAYHYRLLGLEPGADFTAVQAAYNRLAARSDPSRFLAGSQEERDASAIRQRLETSFKALRDALDTTVRRFDLLEFDIPKPSG